MPTTDETKARLFAFIGETTKRAQAAGVVERMKALRSVKEPTARTYERNARNRLDLSSPGGGRLLEGVSGRSFHAIRAALLHEAARLYGEARKAADEAGRAGDLAGQVAAAKKARVAVEAVETIQAARKPENAAPKRTKRATVPKAEGWQAKAFEAATPTQRPAIAVLWAVGCRPAELELGVDIRRGKNGAIVVEVPGAKVSKVSGQPRRMLAIDGSSPEGQALAAVLGDADKLTIQRRAVRLRADLHDIRQKAGLGKVSPYTFRHQVAAELKALYGPDHADKVAEGLGHRVTRSQAHYGNAKQAKGGGILGVKAVEPVKETRAPSLLSRIVKGPSPSGSGPAPD